jgi:hypothetical protein
MKIKETLDPKMMKLEKVLPQQKKPKSLRPMRSMVALRSLKPKTVVAAISRDQESLRAD